MKPSELTVTRNTPEHGQAGAPEVLPAGCCCCCCCCLHTLGGLGGAVVGSATHIETHPARMSDPNSPFPYRYDVFEEDQSLIPPVVLYWLMVSLTVAVTVAVTPLWMGWPPGGPDIREVLIAGLFVAVMLLPGLQLIASLLAYLVVLLFYPERGYALRRVTRISLYSFAGTALGLLLMGGCLGVLLLSR